METQSISLNVHPQILDLYEVLEKNGLHKQKEDVQSLVGYIESMEYNLSVMMNEIQEMHAEVNLLHDKGIRAKCAKIVTKAEDKILQVGTMVSVAKGKVVESAGAAVKAFKEKGKSALVQAVESMRIPAALSKIKSGFSHAAQSMRQYAGQIDVIRGELHEVGGHMKTPDAPFWADRRSKTGFWKQIKACLPSCGAFLNPAALRFPKWRAVRIS